MNKFLNDITVRNDSIQTTRSKKSFPISRNHFIENKEALASYLKKFLLLLRSLIFSLIILFSSSYHTQIQFKIIFKSLIYRQGCLALGSEESNRLIKHYKQK